MVGNLEVHRKDQIDDSEEEGTLHRHKEIVEGISVVDLVLAVEMVEAARIVDFVVKRPGEMVGVERSVRYISNVSMMFSYVSQSIRMTSEGRQRKYPHCFALSVVY